MSKHRPGPWAARHDDSMRRRRVGPKDSPMFDVAYCSGATSLEGESNAERIVACVNACEGIEDPSQLQEILEHASNLCTQIQNQVDCEGLPTTILDGIEWLENAIARAHKQT